MIPFNRKAIAVVLSIWKETVFPLNDSSNLWQAIHTASSSRILMWLFLPFSSGHLPLKVRLFMWPHNSPWRHLLSQLLLLGVWISTLVVAWRCTNKEGSEQPLGLALALWTDQLESCNSPWASIVGDESVILPVVVPYWQNVSIPVASSPLCMWWGGGHFGCLGLSCQDLVLGK